MAEESLTASLQKLSLQHKVSVSLSKTEPHYVLGLAAQHVGGADSLVAAASSNFVVRLYSRCRLAQTNTLKGHDNVISSIRFLHTDPDLIMTASHDHSVRIWDPRTSVSKEVQRFSGQQNTKCSLLSCDINMSDRVMCAGTEMSNDDAYLLFWDRRKDKLLGCYEDSHHDDITQVHFSPTSDQSLLTGSTDGLVNVFDVLQTSEDDALMSTYNTEATVERAGWCGPQSQHAYAITHMLTWHVWDTEKDEDVQQLTDLEQKLKGQCQADYLVDCIPAAQSTSPPHLVAGTHTGDLHLLDLSDLEKVKVMRSLSGGHSDTVRCLHWDMQSETLVTGGEDSMLCLWSFDVSAIQSPTPKQGKAKGKRRLGGSRSTPYSGPRS